jgi:CrcB protein
MCRPARRGRFRDHAIRRLKGDEGIMKQLALVAAGGALGAVSRWALGGWVLHHSGRLTMPAWLFHRADSTFPFGTLAVNLIGCLLAGVLAGVSVRTARVPMDLQLFLMTGILGGFTTFSAFGVDTAYLLRREEYVALFTYVLASVLGGLAILFAVMMAIVKTGAQK